jgi:hypothetical protein
LVLGVVGGEKEDVLGKVEKEAKGLQTCGVVLGVTAAAAASSAPTWPRYIIRNCNIF